jgi:hypothetical protein
MIFQPDSFTADLTPDDISMSAMKAALRDLKVSIRKSAEHPKRAEMLTLLTDARARIDRING